jgi:hypothetical protein
LDPSSLIIKYRRLGLLQQAIVAMVAFFIVNTTYLYFTQPLTRGVILTSASSSLLFMSVFYFVSVFITKKNIEYEMRCKGPKKGLRKV